MKKWNGELNPGGIIGGVVCFVAAGWFVWINLDDPENFGRSEARVPIIALIVGAFVGTVLWSFVFKRR